MANDRLTEQDCLEHNRKAKLYNTYLKKSLEIKEREIFARRREAIESSKRSGVAVEIRKFEKELAEAEATYFKKVKLLWRRNPGKREGIFLAVTKDGRRVEASYYYYRNIIMIQGDETQYPEDHSPIMFWGARIGTPKVLPYNYNNNGWKNGKWNR